MTGELLMHARELLAQCPCGGDDARVSFWALLVPAAALLLAMAVREIWTRAKTKGPLETEKDETLREEPADGDRDRIE